MSKKTISSKTLRPMTPEAIEAAARTDRDVQPLTPGDLKRMKRTPQAKIIRRALALTQEEFAVRFHIPLGTLRDWEQGRAEPDQPTQAYLRVIAREPERVERVLVWPSVAARADQNERGDKPDLGATKASAARRPRDFSPGAAFHWVTRLVEAVRRARI